MTKKNLLTGDRPTGSLHIGHYLGSIKNRVLLQEEYCCSNIIADLHTLTTSFTKESIENMHVNIFEMVVDYIACGIDPKKTDIFLQSGCKAVYMMYLLFSMLANVNRINGLPSIKEMMANAKMDEVSLGLLGYPVMQAADILLAKASVVPVGKDNLAHVEISRDIARKFNMLFGESFVVPEALLSDVSSLPGFDGNGKMSKSAGNAIYFSDESDVVVKKVMRIPTDPNRIRSDIPGIVEGNTLFIFHDAFNDDKDLLESLKSRYRLGTIGDVEVKKVLIDKIEALLSPIRAKRKELLLSKEYITGVLRDGTEKVSARYDLVISQVFEKTGLGYIF